ncbi:MAG: nucleotide exchange factor GrpE [Bacteroidetes bacterium]|nr:nucleotide exchange factor GrpE [Bacteroidota bacterium]
MEEQVNKLTEAEHTQEEALTNSAEQVENTTEESELDKLNAELESYKDKYIRTIAEFDNFKRRNAKERIELMQTAGKDIITELLDVLDDCERAQQTIEKAGSAESAEWEGVKLVFNKLKTKLQNRGLKAMETINQIFDADLHEAITEIPAPHEEMKGKIIDEVVKGYLLNDKVIRHPKVVVGK